SRNRQSRLSFGRTSGVPGWRCNNHQRTPEARPRHISTSIRPYCLFLLHYESGTARPHGRENNDARWFALADLEGPERALVVPLAHAAACAVLRNEVTIIAPQSASAWPGHDAAEWSVFL
ncbi:MAG: hypothetical protein ACR2JY_15525, partial [Chloroflexota bacterium]